MITPDSSYVESATPLERRVTQLERRCRRLRLVISGLTVAVLIGLLVAANGTNQDVTRTQGLEVVDASGQVRMRLGKSNDGGYGIVISDAEGRRRATFFGGDSGAGMHMFQKSDTAQMSLVTRPNGTALVLRDLPGKPRAVINVSNAAVQLEMRDAIGQVVFLAPPAQHDPNRIIP